MANQSSQFENILLPPVILAGLFSQSLVIIDQVESKAGTKPVLSSSNTAEPYLTQVENIIEIAEPRLSIQPDKLTVNKLGDFNKQVLVFVDDKTSLHLADAELELLGKMLQAIKLSFADIAIINLANQDCKWEFVQTQLPAKQVILFGVEPTSIRIPVRFPHFRVQEWDGISFLFSPALSEINQPSANQVMLKKELWKALREMFHQ
jgi:hypothetical protein